MNKSKFLLFLSLYLISYNSDIVAQHNAVFSDTTKSQKRNINFDRSLHLTAGFTSYLYRDFATSPLFYNGIGMRTAIGYELKSDKNEHFLDVDFIIGAAFAQNPLPLSPGNSTMAFLNSSNVYYHYLHELYSPSESKYKAFFGGGFASTFNVRVNSALNNNSVGIENISNFMIALKLNKDISRHKIVIEDLFLFKRKLLPAKRNLSFQLNIGVLNFNYRPGYAYNYLGEMDGSSTNVLKYALENHQWAMNGIRLQTRFEYAYFKPYKNGSKWAYVWDFANVPGNFEKYQSAFHRLEYVLIINRNKQ